MSKAFEQQIYSALSGDAGVTAIVGKDASGQLAIYPLVLPEIQTMPAITFLKVSAPVMSTQERADLFHVHLRVNCWGKSYDDALAVADAVLPVLNRSGVAAKNSVVVDQGQDWRDPESGLFRRMVDFEMWSDV